MTNKPIAQYINNNCELSIANLNPDGGEQKYFYSNSDKNNKEKRELIIDLYDDRICFDYSKLFGDDPGTDVILLKDLQVGPLKSNDNDDSSFYDPKLMVFIALNVIYTVEIYEEDDHKLVYFSGDVLAAKNPGEYN